MEKKKKVGLPSCAFVEDPCCAVERVFERVDKRVVLEAYMQFMADFLCILSNLIQLKK